MKGEVVLYRAVWVAVAAGGVLGLVGVVILLRGDPTYLVQAWTRDGQPYGDPAPISFAWRAVSSMLLAGGLFLAGRRAVADAGTGVRLTAVIGYTLLLVDAAVLAGTGPAFRAFLAIPWLVLPLLAVVYAEAVSDLLEGPPAFRGRSSLSGTHLP